MNEKTKPLLEEYRKKIEKETEVLAQLITATDTGSFRITFLVPIRDENNRLKILCLDHLLSLVFEKRVKISRKLADGLLVGEDKGREMIEDLSQEMFGSRTALLFSYRY